MYLIFPETSASEIQLSQENDMLITESIGSNTNKPLEN